jgi:hypothetical protein
VSRSPLAGIRAQLFPRASCSNGTFNAFSQKPIAADRRWQWNVECRISEIARNHFPKHWRSLGSLLRISKFRGSEVSEATSIYTNSRLAGWFGEAKASSKAQKVLTVVCIFTSQYYAILHNWQSPSRICQSMGLRKCAVFQMSDQPGRFNRRIDFADPLPAARPRSSAQDSEL